MLFVREAVAVRNMCGYPALFASQNEQCAICGDEITFVKSHLDHCHKTGKVRGFLCHWCNHIIGNAKDDPVRLEAAILYLNEFVTDEVGDLPQS
jgi:hypothetical protein